MIENRVEKSGLVQLDIDDFCVDEKDICVYDLADDLYDECLLKEKHFRESLKNREFSKYKDKYVYIVCSVDTIIPNWAYMLLVRELCLFVKNSFVASYEECVYCLMQKNIETLDIEKYRGKKVLIKGCGKYSNISNLYVLLTEKLLPVADSIMYGEACSSVPVYKKK